MNTNNKLKIFNDPIYGFITIPNTLIFDLIAHKYFQRLRRISQMGLSYLVYPGAHHTRFHHALGCLHLMQNAVRILRFKGVQISEAEENGLYIAILLHDIGHGPFSHAMEHSIVENISHEAISLKFMETLNIEFKGALDVAISMFKGDYSRKFFGQLISGQLDIDRSDYLKRDSFYTGVSEGNINSERLISMMNVVNDELVIEEKGIYSIEKFLTARRLMYWQVYLHKTSLVAEQMITRILKRAKELTHKGVKLEASSALSFFLNSSTNPTNFEAATLNQFSLLDDYDVMSALKSWQFHDDFVLSHLSEMILNRTLLKIKFKNNRIADSKVESIKQDLMLEYTLDAHEASYFVFNGHVENLAYNPQQGGLKILYKNGKIKDIIKASDHLSSKVLSKTVTKHYICFPKDIL
ncbi:phosphohydrolase [Formosa sp. Hel1_33_131]|uniref:HD domain-containing protein n=1 Tax=Formosa sp. Hel1_33_131 TaxID=1336794 RepID=UPI00084E3702|nr:HD domain-containing protein [Formosa sp. Hel1_33_131]AOR27093.1 phosphohydrolase [Formosa sp. Hel1_33_131]